MIHDVEQYIAEVSKYCTLYPGDVMWMGTDGSPRNMKPGDVCEVEITGIGTLRNKVSQATKADRLVKITCLPARWQVHEGVATETRTVWAS